MNENFLYYIWKFRLYDCNLTTTKGEAIDVLNTGIQNHDSGPDFFNAKIRIGNTIWAGNVEIHILTSDWFRHSHENDKAYNNIILHIVYQHDTEIKRNDIENLPTLELKGKFSEILMTKYKSLMKNNLWIPCQKHINSINPFIINKWLESILIERLERKSEKFEQALHLYKNNWELVFFLKLARSFGFGVNSDAFELLAKTIPFHVINKHSNNLNDIEALLFGQAGFLSNDFTDEYPVMLKKKYLLLKKQYNLTHIEKHLWKFMRLRPSNFPSLRIAQFAVIIIKKGSLFHEIKKIRNLKDIYSIFNIDSSSYWDTHFIFEKPSSDRKKKLGKTAIDLIIINTIVPFLFYYGKINNRPKHFDLAVELLNDLDGENNNCIRKWKLIIKKNKTNAFQSQALLELKKNYCDKKKCLNCELGNQILKKN